MALIDGWHHVILETKVEPGTASQPGFTDPQVELLRSLEGLFVPKVNPDDPGEEQAFLPIPGAAEIEGDLAAVAARLGIREIRLTAEEAETKSLVAGRIKEPDLEAILEHPLVVLVHDNPEIRPMANCQPGHSDGVAADARSAIHPVLGRTGAGVSVGICDTGVDERWVTSNIASGLSPNTVFPPGTDISVIPHGTMVAWNVRNIAPDSELLDYGVLKVTEPGLKVLLDTADDIYEKAINAYLASGHPKILCNSWGVVVPDKKLPGRMINYFDNPNHSFNRRVNQAVFPKRGKGMFVVFAAGNCGPDCPDSACGTNTKIAGAAALGGVFTISAVDLTGDIMGYSSEGDSLMSATQGDKPDFCSPSQFRGFFEEELNLKIPDGGTSTAAPVFAGGLATLVEAMPHAHPLDVKLKLTETAVDPVPNATPPHHKRYGWGLPCFQDAYTS